VFILWPEAGPSSNFCIFNVCLEAVLNCFSWIGVLPFEMLDVFFFLQYEPALRILLTKFDYLPIEIRVPVFLLTELYC
jgi:hypothetical protein